MKIKGTVVHGIKEGTDLGYPTANLNVQPDLEYGVYAALISLSGSELPGIICYGVPGKDGKPKFEVHVFDFVADLYNREVEVEIVGEKISDVEDVKNDALQKKIADDIAKARIILSKNSK